MSMFSLFKNNIKTIFERHPILANSSTGFITFSCGDVISQAILLNINNKHINNINNYYYYYQSKIIKINFDKALCTGILGAFMNGIVMKAWYKGLDNIFGSSMNSKRTIFMKIISDQIIFAPIAIVIFFMNSTAYKTLRSDLLNDNISNEYITSNNNSNNNNKFIDNLIDKINTSFITAFKGDCAVWPIVNLINFSLIPINYRPTFIGCVQLGWQSWLSIITNKSKDNDVELVKNIEEIKEANIVINVINIKEDINLTRK